MPKAQIIMLLETVQPIPARINWLHEFFGSGKLSLCDTPYKSGVKRLRELITTRVPAVLNNVIKRQSFPVIAAPNNPRYPLPKVVFSPYLDVYNLEAHGRAPCIVTKMLFSPTVTPANLSLTLCRYATAQLPGEPGSEYAPLPAIGRAILTTESSTPEEPECIYSHAYIDVRDFADQCVVLYSDGDGFITNDSGAWLTITTLPSGHSVLAFLPGERPALRWLYDTNLSVRYSPTLSSSLWIPIFPPCLYVAYWSRLSKLALHSKTTLESTLGSAWQATKILDVGMGLGGRI
jgi:hypothetical protein